MRIGVAEATRGTCAHRQRSSWHMSQRTSSKDTIFGDARFRREGSRAEAGKGVIDPAFHHSIAGRRAGGRRSDRSGSRPDGRCSRARRHRHAGARPGAPGSARRPRLARRRPSTTREHLGLERCS
jgi:hypothetical protein